MKKQVFNPFLPNCEYIPDGEPHIFEDRLYVFGSHDKFDGNQFCLNDYVCYSAPLTDLSDWHYHGIMYRKSQDPFAKSDSIMQAPDVVQGNDGKYYLYYALGKVPFVSVAVSEKPSGPYKYHGIVRWEDGTIAGSRENDIFMFDPGVFKDDDGKIYLYTGFGPEEEGFFKDICKKYQMNGAYAFLLDDDMITIKEYYGSIVPKKKYSKGTSFEGYGFYEAASMRKIENTYYFIYSSERSHELCYATSHSPFKDFVFQGTLISNCDYGLSGSVKYKNYAGNTHGSIVCVNDQWYVFYHRQTNGHTYSRQACAEKLERTKSGHFLQAELTSCGLNDGVLSGNGIYNCSIACHLWSKEGAIYYHAEKDYKKGNHPYFTQKEEDGSTVETQYIANIQDETVVGYKYFDLSKTKEIGIKLDGNGEGKIVLSYDEEFGQEAILGEIEVVATDEKLWFTSVLHTSGSVHSALYLKYMGSGDVNLYKLKLEG
ncbi:family 43 glycosylhydrolase [Streptococcus oriscaviae]|uniref:Family 43 glycosylhydrolase n=1 Tax=Streptococcus oriscaviae TaxID=2781599 RepID=A0ABX7YJT8_9STRE|nr:family 43 glycosylhydrolase [Streptococcus oriscaviae]QUE54025.1 family 43 glycosylhydrolase [Streptococcus oriscaviae]